MPEKLKEKIKADRNNALCRAILSFHSRIMLWIEILIKNILEVNPFWRIKLKLKNAFSRKIKVGFGPITENEKTLGRRKFHIDPIVEYINKNSKKYTAGIFFNDSDLSKFDIIIIVANFSFLEANALDSLKKDGKLLIFQIGDNHPLGTDYTKNPWFIKSLDGIIFDNPFQLNPIKKYSKKAIIKNIHAPIISDLHKESYGSGGKISIIWQGYSENQSFMNKINSIVEKLAKDTGKNIELIYNTNLPEKKEGVIRFVKWSIKNAFSMLAGSDIAVVIKPINNAYQQRKPPTKLITYMAAGLPTVCMPSAGDKLIIKHGKTGFFAYSKKDWRKYLKKLVESPELREKIGRAARKYALENFSMEKTGRKYLNFFDELWARKTAGTYLSSG